jgi:uncharacterized membrane protein
LASRAHQEAVNDQQTHLPIERLLFSLKLTSVFFFVLVQQKHKISYKNRYSPEKKKSNNQEPYNDTERRVYAEVLSLQMLNKTTKTPQRKKEKNYKKKQINTHIRNRNLFKAHNRYTTLLH